MRVLIAVATLLLVGCADSSEVVSATIDENGIIRMERAEQASIVVKRGRDRRWRSWPEMKGFNFHSKIPRWKLNEIEAYLLEHGNSWPEAHLE